MLHLIALDLFLYNLTSYNLHLIVLGLPLQKNMTILLLYFLFLAFFEWKFIINFLILTLVFYLLKYLNKHVKLNVGTYIIEVMLAYTIYIFTSNLVAIII